ncbi:MAG TPA: hypothetical protein VKA54_18235, partial [Gemmatimonadaceae bacterium]|nr:hypothetical protein [Gemmatimonadaceae bacterium]
AEQRDEQISDVHLGTDGGSVAEGGRASARTSTGSEVINTETIQQLGWSQRSCDPDYTCELGTNLRPMFGLGSQFACEKFHKR